MHHLSIAIAQLNPTIGDLSGNSQLIYDSARSAHGQRADMLVTPELSICGYPPRDLLLDRHFLHTMTEAVHNLAKRIAEEISPDLGVLVGTALPNDRPDGKPLLNCGVLLRGGMIQQIFPKRLLPTYDVFDEDRYFAPGDTSQFFELAGVRIGVTICEDMWNDRDFWGKSLYKNNPVAELASQGIDLLINMSASPYALGKPERRLEMIKHSAVSHNLPVVYVNQVGGNDDLIFDGSSVAFSRHGQMVDLLPSFRSSFGVWQFAGKDLIPKSAPALPEPLQQVWEALVLGLQDYARKCGFRQAVLGLSGGIDSALVAVIATCALGKANVLGVLMPSPYSSPGSVTDALELAKNLGIATAIIPIEPMMGEFERSLAPLFGDRAPDVTEENLQSRIRGTLLMAISNKFGHLLLSTGNKSEMAVGYCTLYGDMNGGLAVIADVPKTQVYALCQWLNDHTAYRIPSAILTKAPSAELRPDQRDQDSLPPYPILDDILQKRLDHHATAEELIQAGHDRGTVLKVLQLLKNAEFKRRQAPPGLKITNRAFGSGWRMPIACRSSYL
jgi:NAD+ synthetase